MTPKSLCLYIEPREFGGAEQMLLSLVKNLDRQRWRPTLICDSTLNGAAPLMDRAKSLELEIIDLPATGYGVRAIWRARAVRQRLAVVRPDVFHAHLSWPLDCKFAVAAATRVVKASTVVTVHSMPTFRLNYSVRRQLKSQARRVGAYIVSANSMAREMRTTLQMSSARIHVVRNGIDADAYEISSDSDLRRTLAPEGAHIVMTAARLVRDKGIEYLLAAMAEVPDSVCLVVAGDGDDRPRLEELARRYRLNGRVRFLGHRDDIDRLVAVSDLFVMPTLWEGVERSRRAAPGDADDFLPVAVMEAMAASKPVVMTQIAGGDAIDDGVNGWRVPPRDAAAIAQAIRALFEDATLRHTIGTRAGQMVRERFSIADTVEKTTDIYQKLLDGSRCDGASSPAIDSPPRPHS